MTRRLAPGLAAICLAGCALTFDARSLGVPAVMSLPAGQPIVGDTFNVTVRSLHAFWGIAAVRVPSLQNTLAGQLGGSAGVANLRIRVRRRWSDVLFTGMTLGFLTTTSVTFEGIVVRTSPQGGP